MWFYGKVINRRDYGVFEDNATDDGEKGKVN